MKKIKLLPIIAIVFLIIGVFYLDFDNLSVYKNIKAYILIVMGVSTLGFSFFNPEKVNATKK
ncbi:hypothetical protein SAMN04488096_102363 [Mesonia phycicola]|uniref:Uncharacterized protein n=1 Tax=Mesonia phycicola TaxID=579105 RepID=A0A1M6C4I1_9FLAO|nr:hypothetical protein [Mesonia phycicola]SHI55965.1 hypothetical protein SAMN04488096_102363 [Mesonia phycicola]